MDNLILIESNNTFLINKKIEELNKEKYTIEYKDLSNISINDVILDLDTYNFINPNRIVVCTNTTDMFKEDLTLFEKYIENPNKENILVLIIPALDNRKKISKKIEKQFKKIDLEINPISYIKNNLNEYRMREDAISTLIERTTGDISSIHNELDKLKMYKLEEKEITKEDVIEVCYRHINDSDDYIFTFVDCILNKERKKAFSIYEDLKKLNVEPLSLIGLISSQVRSMLQVKILSNRKESDIASFLKMHPYRVKKIKEKNTSYSKKELILMMKKLYDIDLSIKSGIINATLAIELLIAEGADE